MILNPTFRNIKHSNKELFKKEYKSFKIHKFSQYITIIILLLL